MTDWRDFSEESSISAGDVLLPSQFLNAVSKRVDTFERKIMFEILKQAQLDLTKHCRFKKES